MNFSGSCPRCGANLSGTTSAVVCERCGWPAGSVHIDPTPPEALPWVCPRCGTMNGPNTPYCHCPPDDIGALR